MIRARTVSRPKEARIPRESGDDPDAANVDDVPNVYSPRERG